MYAAGDNKIVFLISYDIHFVFANGLWVNKQSLLALIKIAMVIAINNAIISVTSKSIFIYVSQISYF